MTTESERAGAPSRADSAATVFASTSKGCCCMAAGPGFRGSEETGEDSRGRSCRQPLPSARTVAGSAPSGRARAHHLLDKRSRPIAGSAVRSAGAMGCRNACGARYCRASKRCTGGAGSAGTPASRQSLAIALWRARTGARGSAPPPVAGPRMLAVRAARGSALASSRMVARVAAPSTAAALRPAPAGAAPARAYSRKYGQRDRPRPYHKQKRRPKSEPVGSPGRGSAACAPQ